MNKKFCEVLRETRKNCGYTMPQIEKQLALMGFPGGKSSVSRWERGKSNPSIDQFIAMCRIYHIRDVVGVFSDGQVIPYLDGMNDAGHRKLEEYRQLLIASGLYKAEGNIVEFPKRRITHYEWPASAGNGVFLDSEEYTEVEVGSEVPLSATFGVPLSGDSMEPEFHSGDSVWVHQQQSLEDGEIGLFMLNGQAYVKKLESGKRSIQLISLNKAYPPMRVDASDSFRVLGKVVASTPKPEDA